MKKILLLIIRTVFAILSIIFFSLFVIPMGSNIINPGNIAGAALCAWVFCVCFAPLHRAIRNLFCKNKLTKIIYKAVNILHKTQLRLFWVLRLSHGDHQLCLWEESMLQMII